MIANKNTLKIILLLFLLICSTSNAWIYPEHREITLRAILNLNLEYRTILDNLWVEAIKGTCVKHDTMMLEIKSEFGLIEQTTLSTFVYPNPFSNSVMVHLPRDIEYISIHRSDGSMLKEDEIKTNNEKIHTLSLKGEPPGIYILRIITKEGAISQKLIKK